MAGSSDSINLLTLSHGLPTFYLCSFSLSILLIRSLSWQHSWCSCAACWRSLSTNELVSDSINLLTLSNALHPFCLRSFSFSDMLVRTLSSQHSWCSCAASWRSLSTNELVSDLSTLCLVRLEFAMLHLVKFVQHVWQLVLMELVVELVEL